MAFGAVPQTKWNWSGGIVLKGFVEPFLTRTSIIEEATSWIIEVECLELLLSFFKWLYDKVH